MKIENLIKANYFLIEDYKNLIKENKKLKEENIFFKEKLYGKKRKYKDFEDLEKKEESNKKQKIENYIIGSSVEYLICKIYNDYNSDFEKIFNKNNIDKVFIEENIILFQNLKNYYPYLTYIGNNNNKYDFKYIDINQNINYVSVKSNFNGKKVCPQIIGQTTLYKYKSYFNIDLNINLENLKNYIIENIDILLKKYLLNTFHCDIIYFYKEQKKNILQIIKYDETRLNNIQFDKNNISFSHIKNNKNWIESTTVYYIFNKIMYSIGEFQIHNNRDNIKFRWYFDKIIKLCNFDIIQV